MIDDRTRLLHIRDAIARALEYTRTGREAFFADRMTQDAVVRTLEVIGEATRNLSQELRDKNSEVPWKQIAGLRNRVIHEYFSVDLEIVWDVIEQELPRLREKVEVLLQQLPPNMEAPPASDGTV